MNKIGILIFLAVSLSAFAQSTNIDFNEVYKYDLSIGVEYQNLSPMSDYGTEFNVYYDLSATVRWPLPLLPILQPLATAGIIRFTPPDRDNQLKWEHTHWYGLLGLGYANRFSKNFEVGVDLSLGLSEAVFPSLDPDGVPRGSPNFLASLGAHISLNPSFNMSIDIHPNLRYFHSLTPLNRFDGFVLGIGFAGHYRFGEDPDAPQAIIRSVKISEIDIPPLFAAMQSYYVNNPIGRVTLTNIESFPIYDLEIAFSQAGFMDSSTKAASIPELAPGESAKVDLFASFNQQVFTTEGITPLTGEVSVDYISRRKPAKQSFSVSYDLHDKTALTWDDNRKVGAFITPADSALRNYSSFIRQVAKDEVVSGFSESLQIGMQVFYALKEIGCLYQVDPTSPFTAVQENPLIVDSISLPRDTLKRLTGDCDDLTVLYNSLLETVGIETAFITVPGHIYSAFNTNVPSRSHRQVHPDKDMTLNINGKLWVPVEITMIESHDFLSAWRTGMEEFNALDDDPQQRGLHFTAKSQEIYRPVGLRETDLGLQYGSSAEIVSNFKAAIEKLIDLVVEDYSAAAKESRRKRDYNKLGIAAAQYGRYAQAQKAFNTALSLDRNYLNPIINLGNVFYLKEEYQNALRSYHRAEERLLESGKDDSAVYLRILVNLSKTYHELENYAKSMDYYQRAAVLDPAVAEHFAYLGSGDGGGRAADLSATSTILFIDEEG